MDLGLTGRSILITGGSKGIGFACATGFAEEGAILHLAARDPEQLEAAKRTLVAQHGAKVTCHVADLSRPEAAVALAAACGPVDVLINNAGQIPRGRINEIGDARWREAWDLKVFGYINMTRECYATMCKRGSGVIINIIGLGGERHRPEYIAGTTGNAGLMAFTRALGSESVDHGVRVIGINPGRVETERQIEHIMQAAEKRLGDSARWKEIREELVAGLPFQRSARPDEVADLVVFLASDRASYVSATIVTIDAGQSLRPRAAV
jgi:hypothetical protein